MKETFYNTSKFEQVNIEEAKQLKLSFFKKVRKKLLI